MRKIMNWRICFLDRAFVRGKRGMIFFRFEERRKGRLRVGLGIRQLSIRGVAINARTRGGARSWERRKRGNTFEFYWPGVTDSSRFQVPLKNPTWLNFWSNYSQLNKHPPGSQLNNSLPHENSKAAVLAIFLFCPNRSFRVKYTTNIFFFFFCKDFCYFSFFLFFF